MGQKFYYNLQEKQQIFQSVLVWYIYNQDQNTNTRAGLLHDIGKVSEDDSETTHAIIGMKLAEKYGEKKKFVMQ